MIRIESTSWNDVAFVTPPLGLSVLVTDATRRVTWMWAWPGRDG